jgi:hypothetical protein
MFPQNSLVAIALVTLMAHLVHADGGLSGLYTMKDRNRELGAYLYLAPTGRYYFRGLMVVGGGAGRGSGVYFDSTGAWRGKKGEICLEPTIAPYHVFAATVGQDKLVTPSGELAPPSGAVRVFVEALKSNHDNEERAATFFSVGNEFPGRRADSDLSSDEMRFSIGNIDMGYQFVIKPGDSQGYLRFIYNAVGFAYAFPLDPKYNAYQVIRTDQIGYDGGTSKFINPYILELPALDEKTSPDKIPACGRLNKKFTKQQRPPEMSQAQEKEFLEIFVENTDPQHMVKDGVTHARIPLRFLKTVPGIPKRESKE